MKRLPYSLWKDYYHDFKSEDYDPATKTILVDIPDRKRIQYPKSWRKSGNHYYTPGGCTVIFWNTGFARNYLVENGVGYRKVSKTIHPGIDSFDRLLRTVEELEKRT